MEIIDLKANEFWVKVVEFLQQNWAVIEKTPKGATVWFVNDVSGVFDKLEFQSTPEAIEGLNRNGFVRYSEVGSLSEFITPPAGPYFDAPRAIYSSGLHWCSW